MVWIRSGLAGQSGLVEDVLCHVPVRFVMAVTASQGTLGFGLAWRGEARQGSSGAF